MRRKPKAPPRASSRPQPRLQDVPPARANSFFGVAFNYGTMAILAAVFTLGIGIGIAFSSTANFSPENVASREVIDRSAPNAEMCVQYGASAVTMDVRAFLTMNPFSVYISRPTMQPGCVLRRNNWALLERNNQVTSEQVRECKQRLNTFGFTGDITGKGATPRIDCIYQNDSANNFFLDRSLGDTPSETDNF